MIERTFRQIVPAVVGLDVTVQRLAGYDLNRKANKRTGNSLLFDGRNPGENSDGVKIKMSRAATPAAIEITKSGTLFQARARRLTPNVPSVLLYTTQPLEVDGLKIGRMPDQQSPLVQEFPLLVMERIPGVTLQDRVDNHGPLSPQELFDGLLPVAMAIDDFGRPNAGVGYYSQQPGIVHRDLKPGNVLLDPTGSGHVIDFDIAGEVGDVNRNGIVSYSPGYAASEQLQVNGVVTHKTNVDGFGKLVAFAYYGDNLMPTDPNRFMNVMGSRQGYEMYLDSRMGHIPQAEQDVIRRAGAYRPPDRYDTCVEVLVDFVKATHTPDRSYVYQ